MNGEQVIHPARETLAAFGLGKLQPDEAMTVETHIAECEECCETLHDLGNDTFADLIRQSDALQLDAVEGTVGLNQPASDTVHNLPDELAAHPRYRVLELLGKGGMGNVYKAEHTLMNRRVALKVINPELVQNGQAVQRFRREVQSAAQLAHPNIVAAHDAEQAGDLHFLVMEYVLGDDLSAVVKRDGPLEIAKACDYIRQVALGLQHAHESGMVHRDIKPHNLMVTAKGQIKILDLGLATLVIESGSVKKEDQSSQHDSSERTGPNLTSAGSMMGTPDYISPEQASDARDADVRSDIYSLGCTFYYLLTGRPPFSEGSAMERVKAHGKLEPEPIENVRSDIPPELADVVRRMMAKQPANRFQTPADVADALARIIHSDSTMPTANTRADSEPRTVSPRFSWWPPTTVQSLACAAFALVLAGIIYVATDSGTLVVESADDRVEIIIHPANGDAKDGNPSAQQMRIVDTVTGSTVTRLRSGEYLLDLKGDENEYELDKDRFVLQRGDSVIVKVTRKRHPDRMLTQLAPTTRPIWTEPIDTQGSPSPDGRWLTFNNWPTRELAVRDLETGETHQIETPWSQDGGFPYFHIWSPDGAWIAMSWADNNSNYNHLRIIRRDGSGSREVYHESQFPYITPVAWTISDEILAIQQRSDRTTRFVLVSVTDGSLRSLHSLGWDWPLHSSLSPDGRFVVYDLPQEEGAPHRDIFLLATNGDFQTTLIEHAAHDYAPIWMPDGRRIVFTSNRNGSVNLWALNVEDGKPSSAPQQIPIDMNRMLPMGVSRDGTYYYRDTRFSTASDIYVASFNPKTGSLLGAPRKASQQHEGFNSGPCWSHDGKRLAFGSLRGPLINVYDSPVPVVRNFETGRERALPMHERMSLRAWSSDDKALILAGQNAKRQRGFYSMDVETAEVSLLFRTGPRPGRAVCSPDGQTVFYIPNRFGFVPFLFSYNLVTDEKKRLYQVVKTDQPDPRVSLHSLAVSPDGQQLAFASREEIRLISTSGGDSRVFVRMTGRQEIPYAVGIAWTPDGNSLIYGTGHPPSNAAHARQPYDQTQLWLADVDGGEPRRLGLPVDGLSDIALHPHGKKIAYTVSSKNDRSMVKGIWALENFLPPLEEKDMGSDKPQD